MPCYHPMNLVVKKRYVTVPCNKCIGCRLEYSRQWAVRCVNESKMHEHNQFLTLTYRDEDLVFGNLAPTLEPRELQLFIKRLRKEYGDGIRYFACGEYGDESYRPHYHACFFGLDIEDKKLYSIKDGIKLYSSGTIDRIWGHGFCTIGDVNFETAAYVARYVMKKIMGPDNNIYEERGIEPEFARMSRRPGIGLKWLEKYSADVFNHGYQVVNGIKCKPPRYYQLKFAENEPDVMAQRKKDAINEMFSEENYEAPRLEVKEKVLKSRIKSLTRSI